MTKMKFDWTGNESQDDFTCKTNGCCLRAEQMEAGVWWWCVYMPDGEQIDSWSKGEWAKTKEEALELAENTYLSLQEIKPV